ncbi:MAG: helix-turn-helix domain-containing protein [Thermodesulfobacteriota bacterium]
MSTPKNRQLVRFGQNLKAQRFRTGLSQEELANKAGLDRSYVGGVERGERNVSLLNILKLAESLGISISELVAGLGNE